MRNGPTPSVLLRPEAPALFQQTLKEPRKQTDAMEAPAMTHRASTPAHLLLKPLDPILSQVICKRGVKSINAQQTALSATHNRASAGTHGSCSRRGQGRSRCN